VKLDGLAPIVNTPFTDKLALDLESVERLIAASLEDGASAFIVPAVASEVSKLSVAERLALLETVLRCAGDAPVVGGAGAGDTRATLAEYARIGCRAVMVQLPSEGTVAYVQSLPLEAFEYVILQDLDWSGSGLPIETIERLADTIPNFRCLKAETVPAGVKYSAVQHACPQLQLAGGWALPQMIEALDRGVRVFTTTAVNLPFRRVLDHYFEGEREQAWHVFERALSFLAWTHQHIDVSIHFLKHYCVRRDLFTTAAVRPPALTYDAHHQRVGDELLDRLLAFEAELR
jgi:4-hydroxy-tetrahydrodipicolinate synthase